MRILYYLPEDFENPQGDRRVVNDIDRIWTVPAKTWFICSANSTGERWSVRGRGYNHPRREFIETIMPHLEETPVTTLVHITILFDLKEGPLQRFITKMVDSKRITLPELVEFLEKDIGDE